MSLKKGTNKQSEASLPAVDDSLSEDSVTQEHVFDDEELKKCKRITLPPTKNAKIDKNLLRKAIAQSSIEMEKYITTGFMPIFGYQLVCYSPVVASEETGIKMP